MTVAVIWILCEMGAPWWVIAVTIALAALKVLAALKAVSEAMEEE